MFSSHYRRKNINGNRLYSEKQSFVKALLRSFAYEVALFCFYCIIVLFDMAKSNVSIIATLLWLVGSIAILVYFIYYIYRCYKEDNLRF